MRLENELGHGSCVPWPVSGGWQPLHLVLGRGRIRKAGGAQCLAKARY